MQDFWQKLEIEVEKLAPDLLCKFHLGADDYAIAQAEQRLEMALPEDVKALFHGHNGSDGACFGHWGFLSLDTMCDAWLTLNERYPSAGFMGVDDALKCWNRSWLPLLQAGPLGPYMFIKLEQSSRGMQTGSVFLHEVIETNTLIKFPTLSAFLEELIEDVRTEGYAYDEQEQRLRSIACYLALEPVGETPWKEGYYEGQKEQEESSRRVTYPGLACLSYTRSYAGCINAALERSIEQSWEIIQAAMDAHSLKIRRWPEPVAYNFQQIEEEIQMPFPEEMKIWYTCCGRPGGIGLDWWNWCSLYDLMVKWQQKQREESPDPRLPIPFPFPETYLVNADSRVQPVWWHPRWLPFMYHADESLYCVDMAPTLQGQEGQIIVLLHWGLPYRNHRIDVTQVPPVLWVAPDLRVFLAVVAQDLLEGKYHYDEKSFSLWSREGVAYVQEDVDLKELTLLVGDRQIDG